MTTYKAQSVSAIWPIACSHIVQCLMQELKLASAFQAYLLSRISASSDDSHTADLED